MTSNAPAIAQSERPSRILCAAVLIAAVLTATLAGHIASARAELLRDPSLSLAGLAALAVTVAGLLVVFRGAALVFLVAFVYLNAAPLLARSFGLPSPFLLLLVPMAAALWLDRGAIAARFKGLLLLTAGLAAVTMVLAASTLFVGDTGLANERIFESARLLVIYILVLALASSVERIEWGVLSLLAGGALVSGLGVFQILSGNLREEFWGLARIKNAQIYDDVFEARIGGPVGDPNFFAQSLLMLVPLALVVGGGERSPLRKLFGYGSAALIGGATLLTYSRGGALALGTALFTTVVVNRALRKPVAIAFAVAAGGALLLSNDFTTRLRTLRLIAPDGEAGGRRDSSIEKRKLLNLAAWRMFEDHPVLGVGAGNYTVHYARYASALGSTAPQYEGPDARRYPHNLYLETLAETGAIGLVVFLFVVGACFHYLRRARRGFADARQPYAAELASAFQAALVGYLVSSVFLHGHYLHYLWLLFAFSAALYSLAPRSLSS